MNREFIEAYEVLGVSPGVSPKELKAAHRDLAKVWHPDRFAHDPRLQQKAQEKLKEINEAYELLTNKNRVRPKVVTHMGRDFTARPANTAPRQSAGWHLVLSALLLFGVVFFVTTRTLIRDRSHGTAQTAQLEGSTPAESQEDVAATQSDLKDERKSQTRDIVEPSQNARAEAPSFENGSEVMQPLPTVTVLIDPDSGKVATASCPVKSKMTYPRGNEPTAYCDVVHIAPAAKDSKIKSIAKRVSSPGKWLGGNDNQDKKDQK